MGKVDWSVRSIVNVHSDWWGEISARSGPIFGMCKAHLVKCVVVMGSGGRFIGLIVINDLVFVVLVKVYFGTQMWRNCTTGCPKPAPKFDPCLAVSRAPWSPLDNCRRILHSALVLY
jgi:hypothetical protein